MNNFNTTIRTAVNNTVHIAINNTKMLLKEYYVATLEQRCDVKGAAGSTIDGVVNVEEMENLLNTVEWKEYSHSAIADGCEGFVTPIPGKMGVVELSSLADDTEVVLDDRKGTGKVTPTVCGIDRVPVDFTVLIVGPEKIEEETVQVMYTFHPGEPITPSRVSASEKYKHGTKITVKEAKGIGLLYAKII